MRQRHGTPITFEAALEKSWKNLEITTEEMEAATNKYTREYEAAPEGPPETATKRQCMRCRQEVETKKGGLAWHKCPHDQVCTSSDKGGPKCKTCLSAVHRYWEDKKDRDAGS